MLVPLSGFAPLVHTVKPVTMAICEPNCFLIHSRPFNGLLLCYPGPRPFSCSLIKLCSRVFGRICRPYIFSPYMDAWPVVCHPFRACWHVHLVPLPCTRMLGRFFAKFSVFYSFFGLSRRVWAFRERFFALAWYTRKFFLEFDLSAFLYGSICISGV